MSRQSMAHELQECKQVNAVLNAKVSILEGRILSARAGLLKLRADMVYSMIYQRFAKPYEQMPKITMTPEYAKSYSQFRFIIQPMHYD